MNNLLSAKLLQKSADSGNGIRGGNDGATSTDAGGTSSFELGKVFQRDAADGDKWDIGREFLMGLCGIGRAGKDGEVGFVFGGRGKHGAEGKISGAVTHRLAALREIFGGDANDFVGAEKLTGISAGEIGLAKVNAVRVGEDGDIRPVVDDRE
jgi:hypothetical protein